LPNPPIEFRVAQALQFIAGDGIGRVVGLHVDFLPSVLCLDLHWAFVRPPFRAALLDKSFGRYRVVEPGHGPFVLGDVVVFDEPGFRLFSLKHVGGHD
jgi:hypothetical protein